MNSIRASGGNLNRLDYQAPCESKWLWDNCIILYSNERRTVNGWTTERRASQNDTGWLYHFGSTAFFIARIARTTKKSFPLDREKTFSFVQIFFGTLEQFRFLALFLIRRERKIRVFSFRGFKNEGVFLYMVKDIRSCRKNWILFSTTWVYFPTPLSKEDGGHSLSAILDNWIAVRTEYDFAMTPKGRAKRRCGENLRGRHTNKTIG